MLAQNLFLNALDLRLMTGESLKTLKDLKLSIDSHSIYIRQNRHNEHLTRRKFTLFKNHFSLTGESMKNRLTTSSFV